MTPAPEHAHNIRRCGSGPRQLVLLHGFSASQRTWDDLVPLIPLERYTIHLLDLAGHGRFLKPADGDYSLKGHARRLVAYLESAGLNDVTMIGHSMGGAVSLLAAQQCSRISRLVLIGCPAYPQKLPRFMAMLSTPLIGPLAAALYPSRRLALRGLQAAFYHHERINEKLIERYAAGYRGLAAARALAATVRSLVPADHETLAGRYHDLALPALLLWGERDRIVKPWQAQRLVGELPSGRLVMIPDCGHNPHEELPVETWREITTFLEA